LWAKLRSGVSQLDPWIHGRRGWGSSADVFNGGHGLKASQLLWLSGRSHNKEIPGWVACEWRSSASQKCAKDCRPESELQKWSTLGSRYKLVFKTFPFNFLNPK